MKQSMTLTLDGERAPSLNRTARSHWAARHREYKRIKFAVRCALPRVVTEGEGFPLKHHATVIVHGYYTGNVQDNDNLDVKPYIDGLKGWVVQDDSPSFVTSDRRVHKAPRGKADRVEIVIEWDNETPGV